MRSKPNRDLLARVFPILTLFTCILIGTLRSVRLSVVIGVSNHFKVFTLSLYIWFARFATNSREDFFLLIQYRIYN